MQPYVLVLVWFVVPLLCALLYSYLKNPIFVPRYLICAVPPWIILGAAGFSRLKRPWTWVLVGALVLTSGRTIAKMYLETDKEEWREAAAYVLAASTGDDAVLFYAYPARIPFEHYVFVNGNPANAPQTVNLLPAVDRQRLYSDLPAPDFGLLDSVRSQVPRIWLVVAHDFPYLGRDRDREVIEQKLLGDFDVSQERRFFGVRVMLYVRKSG